ncbi:MAG: hypothetical protein KF809_16225 [Chloroflexi bacterium]|nr:hypothetical protein [Chloroflexota bacterium]
MSGPSSDTGLLPPVEAHGLERIGYLGCDGRPPFKLALTVVGDRWYLIAGHLWHRGWSVIDVTDPTDPGLVTFVPGPPDTWTAQVQVADGLLLAGLSRIPERFGGRPDAAFEECAIVFDVRDPATPRELSRIRLGGTGAHRSWWAGGTTAWLSANAAGFRNYLLVGMDLSDPEHPTEISRWWLPGQGPGEPDPGPEAGVSLHGPAYVVGDHAWLAYGGAGMVALDLADPTHPELLGRWSVVPPFRGGLFGAGVHTARPLPGRGLAVVHGEAGPERCEGEPDFAGLVDIADPARPRLVSQLPRPVPTAGLAYRTYCDKGGRFGPHDSHLPQGSPWLDDREDRVYLTWFNAGLRVYDIRDPRDPREIAWYVPADPVRRYGPLPASGLVTQSEVVLVDTRGVIYLTDKNAGLTLLRCTV